MINITCFDWSTVSDTSDMTCSVIALTNLWQISCIFVLYIYIKLFRPILTCEVLWLILLLTVVPLFFTSSCRNCLKCDWTNSLPFLYGGSLFAFIFFCLVCQFAVHDILVCHVLSCACFVDKVFVIFKILCLLSSQYLYNFFRFK